MLDTAFRISVLNSLFVLKPPPNTSNFIKHFAPAIQPFGAEWARVHLLPWRRLIGQFGTTCIALLKGGGYLSKALLLTPTPSFISPLADSENSIIAPRTTVAFVNVAVSSSTFPKYYSSLYPPGRRRPFGHRVCVVWLGRCQGQQRRVDKRGA